MSSRRVRRLTIAPGRGEGRALRFVPSEVPCRPRSPPNAIPCSVRGLTEVCVGSVLREGPCGELPPCAPAYHRPRISRVGTSSVFIKQTRRVNAAASPNEN